MAGLGSLVGHGSGADSERQRWSSNLGGAGRGDSAAGDGSSVRRRAGLFAEQRGREKGRGKWGSRPWRAEEGGGRRARGVGARSVVARPGRRRSALWSEQEEMGHPKVGPGLRAAVKISFKNKFQTDSNHIQILLNFNGSKKYPSELKKFEIKYFFEGFDERNNFLHRNLFRFEMDFKLKFRESNV
jgi:hypothetical protein